jgi:hypothetical protein
MKKLYSLVAFALLATVVSAQQVGQVGAIRSLGRDLPSAFNLDRDITCSVDPDTVGLEDFDDRTSGLTIYGNQGGGYIFGVNNLGIQGLNPPGAVEVGQAYVALDPFAIKEVILLFGAKDEVSLDPTSVNLSAKIRTMTGTAQGGTDVNNPQTVTGPGAVLATADFTLADVDTSGNWTVVEFADYIVVDQDFAVTCEFAGLYTSGDTVGLVTNTPGDAEGNFVFSKIGTNWFETNFAYGNQLQVDAVMFAVACEEYLGVGGTGSYHGIQLESYPNPTSGVTTFTYALLADMVDVTLEVYDAKGKLMSTFSEGTKTMGTYKVEMDFSSYPSGNYYYSLTAGGNRLTKKLVKVN